jgi:hypothetical protein
MPEIKEPIAPPESASVGVAPMVESVTPGIGNRPVATVDLSYPKEFKQLSVDVMQPNNPEARVRIADVVQKVSNETKNYNPNQQPQWDKVFVGLLTGRLGDALKWYNGGGVVEEDGRDINGNVFYKVNNERGFTGVYKDANGKTLTPDQVNEINKRGGIFTNSDRKVLETSTWSNIKNTQDLVNKGLTSQLQQTAAAAYATAKEAGAASKNAEEQIKLATGLRPVLDYIGTLDTDRRQKLLGYINRFNSISVGQSGEQAKGGSVGTLDSTGQTKGGSVGGSLSAGKNQEGLGVAPQGYGGGLTGNLSQSNQALNQAQISENERQVQQNSKNNSLQEQQNLQSMIMQELQGVIQSPQQFYDLVRMQALDVANKASYANIPSAVKAPGFAEIPEDDPNLTGYQNVVANRVAQLRNNALMAAWTQELYKATRNAAKTGNILEAGDVESLSKSFTNSDIFKAINNTYRAKLEKDMTGRDPSFQPGDLLVDKNNRIFRYKGAQ